MAPTLTVHYRRLLEDYHGTNLTVTAGTTTFELAPLCRTLYGSVFRFVVPYANGLTIRPRDDVEYQISATSGHVFLAQGCEHVLPNPFASGRFLLALIARSRAWLLVSDSTGVTQESFPVHKNLKRVACVVDRYCFTGNDLKLTVCTDELHLTNPPMHAHIIWKGSDDSNFVDISVGDIEIEATFTDSGEDGLELLCREADLVRGVSKFIRHVPEENRSASAVKTEDPEDSSTSNGSQYLVDLLHCESLPSVLKVYFQMLDQTTHLYSLQVKSSTSSRTIRREKNLYRSSAIFRVPFESGTVSELTLTPIHVLTKKPCRRPVVWRPRMGFSIALSESYDGIQQLASVDKVVKYLRYGDIDEWDAWELRIWNNEREFVVKGQPQIEKGVLLFDLSGILFRKGSIVNAQPIMTKSADLNGITSERVVVIKDVKRTWTAGSVEGGTIFMVQGDKNLVNEAPDHKIMEKNRFIDITYRRWDEEKGYDGWDLWTWEDFENTRCCVALAQTECKDSELGAHFILDRSYFGLGTEISLIPRLGGEAWKDKDNPVRVWNASILNERETGHAITVIQGTDAVLRNLGNDAHNRVVAEVGRDGYVHVYSPAPFDWFITTNDIKRVDVVVTMKNGCSIPVKEVIVRSPVHWCAKLQNVDLLDEDFRVEDVRVCVPGFDSTVLRWQKRSNIDEYYYPGALGVEYGPEECAFRCFAPTADSVDVVLYDEPNGNVGRKVVPMRRIPEGCWKANVSGDLKGKFYKLLANGSDKLLFPGVEVIDPYSKCNTGHTGRGLIFGKDNTRIAARPDVSLSQTIVYELHIRDLTIDEASGVSAKGKYLGLAQRKTKVPKVNSKASMEETARMLNDIKLPATTTIKLGSTSLDHIVEMGVTAVQIMPVQDFDNDESSEDYRWGYMPVHFNSPDGWYASDVNTAARITEFKKLVDALHKAGLKVIMDVVYNHTAEDPNEENVDARFSFNGLAPRYYYRNCGNTPKAHSGDRTCALRPSNMPNCGGCYSNGSGCGNELRTEAPMVRKFILDSLKYWATEYKVDGFRFDLLGLIDIETMSRAVKMLREIDRNIVVYGEPWCGGLTPIVPTGKGAQRSKGFGVFNNDFRDAIRGSPFGVEETFVMDGGRIDEVKKGILGSIDTFTDMPMESINYVECHDNYTLWDHLQMYVRERTDEIQFSDEDVRRMHVLAATVILTSQGVPFLQCGQEMCRTKFGVENSYESPDEINKLRWGEKEKHWSIVQYYAGLIRMRRSHPELFAMGTANKIRQQIAFYEDLSLAVPERCIAYRILSEPEKSTEIRTDDQESNSDSEYCDARETEDEPWSAVIVLFNPTPTNVRFPLPGDGVAWIQVVDEHYAGVVKIAGPFFDGINVSGRSAAILRRATEEEQAEAEVQRRLMCVTDVYANSIGDDILSAYTVSLRTTRTPHEELAHAGLVNRREQNWVNGGKLREVKKTEMVKMKPQKETSVDENDTNLRQATMLVTADQQIGESSTAKST